MIVIFVPLLVFLANTVYLPKLLCLQIAWDFLKNSMIRFRAKDIWCKNTHCMNSMVTKSQIALIFRPFNADRMNNLIYINIGYLCIKKKSHYIKILQCLTCCRHMGYSFRLAARVLLYASSHRQDKTYHGLYYTSRGALALTRNSSMGPPHEGSIRRPIAPFTNALTTELHLAPEYREPML